ncbi:MAG TPA: 2-oxoglutarate dehydrogenase E1 component [Candidatus Polarisedimenticolia bacterium]|nr:2-oxoglutarate dehydrogenase E1 component [Candidatus Polarisedimenticolia bacterium]
MTSIESNVNPANLAFVEELYESFLRDPASVAPEWREYFTQVGNGELKFPQKHFGPSFKPASIFNASRGVSRIPDQASTRAAAGVPPGTQDRIYQLIRLFRVRGHRIAQIDPLGRIPPTPKELEPAFFGFTDAHMDMPVRSEAYQYDGPLTLGLLIQRLRNTYCRSIGVQYMHIDDLSVRRWLQRRMEATENRLQLTREEQLRILTRLTDAVTFEEFIRKKFVGAKTFSLEGSESLIPLLDLAIEKAAEQGVQEIVMGMAHRGRLNVLANIIGKSARQIFREFADTGWKSSPGRGDVKYHLGHSSEWTTASGKKIQLALCFNPSHLELVNGVALGRARARQDCEGDNDHSRSMALLIHGDASFAGEGVVQETLNLSQLAGYSVGGTLHIVVNNQIGFTTGPTESRSTQYATDVAKMLQIPIFHVNGEDPEAVAQVIRLAMDFRHQFKRDVVIDMYGYRRLGHNESDEPTFTQPVLYRTIAERKNVREGYLDHLLQLGEVTREEADDIAAKRRELLEKELSQSQKENPDGTKTLPRAEVTTGTGNGAHPGTAGRPAIVGGPEPSTDETQTAVSRDKMKAILESLSRVPEKFHPHPKLKKFLHSRGEMASGQVPLDWAAGEALALATLAGDGMRIRLSGQDSERGTFSHRHAVLHDYETGEKHFSLQHLPDSKASIEIVNSPLSETGVLGFEYGYSLDCPKSLVLWEAQFGDFWNVAQPIVDQFIASGEDKWQQLSGLVLLLPHGFEGAGPEHSSARLERFLWLAAEDNIQVVYPTTPAQLFHCLRRQALRAWRKPLAVMTPKSLLRHPKAVSSMDDLIQGTFQRVLPDTTASAAAVKRILLCSGKVYYDLAEHREETKREDIAIVRVEQLYPLRAESLERALAGYKDGTPAFWVQEEPVNMGAWNFMQIQLGNKLFNRFPFDGIARAISATPATGSAKRHKQEQTEIIQRAFGEK